MPPMPGLQILLVYDRFLSLCYIRGQDNQDHRDGDLKGKFGYVHFQLPQHVLEWKTRREFSCARPVYHLPCYTSTHSMVSLRIPPKPGVPRNGTTFRIEGSTPTKVKGGHKKHDECFYIFHGSGANYVRRRLIQRASLEVLSATKILLPYGPHQFRQGTAEVKNADLSIFFFGRRSCGALKGQ
jgi:hypothetical protein